MKRAWKIIYKTLFPLCERLGFHITPNHFYWPIPDTRALNNNIWEKGFELVGIDMNEKFQLSLLELFVKNYKQEYDVFPMDKTGIPYQYYLNNGKFESVDGEVLYCMIRYLKPRRVIEIGSGYTTSLSAQAILRNKQEDPTYECCLIAIDPYPCKFVKRGFPGLSEIIEDRVQEISLSFFKLLEENDILLVDSSHVLKIGSDVQYIYLEVLPRLKKGVVIHFHDIFLPAEYPKEWILKEFRFWNEQYLLQAFLMFNRSFEVLWGSSYMHLKYPHKLEVAFKSYKRDERWPGSFWIKRIE